VRAFTGKLDYGPLPVAGVVFADGGVAWTAESEPQFVGGDRPFVISVVAGLRVNAFGFAILEFDAVRPLDRPDRGWVFEFAFRPSF